MRRRALIAAVLTGAGAGCTDPTAVGGAGSESTANETDNTPTIETTTIETTDRSAGGTQSATSSHEVVDTAVEVTGTVPTTAVCPDHIAVIEDATIEEQALTVVITIEREESDVACQDVLGTVDFEATITVEDAPALTDVTVELPDDPV